MKKLPFMLSLLLVAALLLAACGGNANNNNFGTPVVEDPAFEDDGLDPIEPVDPVLEPTPTDLLEEPVVEATETPLADDDVVETPVADDDAAVPVTGDAGDFCYTNRLSHVLDADLVDQNGNLIGEIEGAIVYRNNVLIMSEDALGDDADGLVTDDNAGVDEQPAVDPAAQAGAASTVAYLLIDIDDDLDLFDDDRDILVPYSALNVVTERQPLDVEGNCVFTFNQDVTVLQNAPYFEDGVWEDDLDLRLPDWDLEYNTYWTEQGLIVVNTAEVGEQQVNVASAVFLDDDFSINVRNYVDEDLGEIVEFIIDPQSGNFQYGILARGGILGMGGDHYPIPMEQLTWVHFEDDIDTTDDDFDFDDLGEFLLDVNDEAFDDVDGIGDLDDVDFYAPNWNADYDTFWLNRQPAVEE